MPMTGTGCLGSKSRTTFGELLALRGQSCTMQVTRRNSQILRRIPNRKINRVEELLPRYAAPAAKADADFRLCLTLA